MLKIKKIYEDIVAGYKYAYSATRVKAMRSFLLTERQLASIVEAKDVSEALEILSATTYRSVIPASGSGSEIEQRLNKELVNTLLKIANFVPEAARKVLYEYLGKYEAANLKSILAGIYAKVPKDAKNLFPIKIEEKIYSKLVSSKSIEEFLGYLAGTKYGSALAQAFPEYERTNSLLPLEIALDKTVYESIFETISKFEAPDIEIIKKMIGIEIDILNINSVLRLKAGGIKIKIEEKYTIPNGYILDAKRLEKIGKIENIPDILPALENTPYHEPLNRVMGEYLKTEQLSFFEDALEEFYIKSGKSIQLEDQFGMGTIFGYIIAKTKEIKNLITILKLKEEGFSPEKIKKAVKGWAT